MAVVVRKKGVEIAPETIIEYCRQNLARYKVPAYVEFTDELPRNAAGKVLKRTLREQFTGERSKLQD
jgi:acyl-CoA synthetase (AMP-forming)/AMP-acid ligase II